jgi:PAS domain-containing protein
MRREATGQAGAAITSDDLVAEEQGSRCRNVGLVQQTPQALGARDTFAELHDNAPEALLSVTGPGLIRTANFAAAALLERERRRLVGLPLRLLVHPEDRDLLWSILSQGDSGPLPTLDLRIVTRGGAKPCRLLARRSDWSQGVTYLTLSAVGTASGSYSARALASGGGCDPATG